MSHFHSVVWIDHADAKLFSFNREEVEATKIHAPAMSGHIHHKAGSLGSGKAVAGNEFLSQVEAELRKSNEFLIVGPGTAKLELVRHIHRHAADLDKKLVGVETVDHPTDGQIVAYARKYFDAEDRMRLSDKETLRQTQ